MMDTVKNVQTAKGKRRTLQVAPTLLCEPNSKLQKTLTGKKVEIYTFSLRARRDCGNTMTKACVGCYDHFSSFHSTVKGIRQRNADLIERKEEFFERMNAEITTKKSKAQRQGRKLVIRLHVGGDFKSTAYILQWLTLMAAHPDVGMYFYTRAWQDPEKLSLLNTLRALPNVEGFASVDSTMKQEPPKDWRKAYMGDANPEPAPTCMVMNNGVEDCAECGHCFEDRAAKKNGANVRFPIHGNVAKAQLKKAGVA